MQIRSKAYLRFVWLCRSIRGMVPPHHNDVPVGTSPVLIYIAIVLALFLAMLEIDRHRVELDSIGLLRNGYLIDPTFVGP